MITTPILAAMVLGQTAGPKGIDDAPVTWESAKTDVDLHKWSEATFKVPQYWHRIAYITYRGEGTLNASKIETARGPERIKFSMRDLENAHFEFGGNADAFWALDNTNRVFHKYPLGQQVTQDVLEELAFTELNKGYTGAFGEITESNPTGLTAKYGNWGMPHFYFAKALKITSKSKEGELRVAKMEEMVGELQLSAEVKYDKAGRMKSGSYDVISEAGVFTIEINEVRASEDPVNRAEFAFPTERAKDYKDASGTE